MPKSKPIVCGSIAGRIGGLGVLMHNRAYREGNIPAVYVSFEPSGAREAMDAMRALGIRGLGVTMPYKTEVMRYLDKLDDTARAIGAVNTIVNDGGVLTGYNTDWKGAVDALLQRTQLKGRRAALFGAGGAARAVAYGLKAEGAQVTVFNKSADKGLALCDAFGLVFGGAPGDFAAEAGFDILVNATSLGFRSEECLLRAEQLPPGAVLLDAVAVPPETALVRLARQRGLVVIPGTVMLILQAIAQDELYLGVRPSFESMEAALLENR